MNKAIFLDRDGVINKKGDSYYVCRKEDFILNNGVTEALQYFIGKGYLLVVITNQGGIARKLFTSDDLENLHKFMAGELRKENIELTGIYYCPHHPDIESCLCRKPGTLLFEKAIEDYDIDPSLSFMIGDSEIDIEAAEKMGITAILIPVNGNMMELIVKTGRI
jgi:D-glycero-D-manno-heptose 1,7-bisphosphate phosphatase